MRFQTCQSQMEINHQTQVINSTYIIPKEITELSEWAFDNNVEIKYIDIPNSVKKIGRCAFEECRSAFEDYTKLQSIGIPEKITVLSDETFDCCSMLERIITTTILNIEEATEVCERLKEIIYNGEVLKIIRIYNEMRVIKEKIGSNLKIKEAKQNRRIKRIKDS